MAIIRDGQKWACAQCVRGHRASQCSHDNRELQLVQPKGRPPTQCMHCRGHRKANVHSRCDCGDRAKALGIKDDRSLSSNSSSSSAVTRPRRGSKRSLKLEIGSCACFTGTPCLCGPAKFQSVPYDSKSQSERVNGDLTTVTEHNSIRPPANFEPLLYQDPTLMTHRNPVDSNIDPIHIIDSNPLSDTWIPDQIPIQYPNFNYSLSASVPSCSDSVFPFSSPTENISPTQCPLELPTREQLPQGEIYALQTSHSPMIDQQLEFFYRSGCANPGIVCLCGEGCACVGCATHPGNAATRNAIAHLSHCTNGSMDDYSMEEFPDIIGSD